MHPKGIVYTAGRTHFQLQALLQIFYVRSSAVFKIIMHIYTIRKTIEKENIILNDEV